MSALQVSVVLIRLFAIWCAINAVAWFLDLWTPYSAARYGNAVTAAYAILYALVAVALWKFPVLIARRMLGATISPSPPAADPKALLNVAVIAIGLLLLAQGIPDALGALAIVLEFTQAERTPWSEIKSPIVQFAITLLDPLLGLILMLRAPQVTKLLWSKVREGSAGDI